MIKNKTVFVLGAGASKPYGYPTGEELFKEVLRLEKHPGFLNFLNKAFPSHEVIALSGIRRTETKKKKTQHEFEKFIDELANSGLVSVDSFIEKRQTHSAFCKFAIAYLLLEREWHNPSNTALIENSDWYRYLFSKLLNGKSFEETLENNVSFITFNYDVSFDSFFTRALVHQYPNCDRGKYFSKNPIIHMHGNIRTSEFIKINELVDFTNVECAQKVLEFSKNINFYFESASTEAIALARKELSEAHNVFFLGFGFFAR